MNDGRGNDGTAGPSPFRIALLCTGNRFRSPLLAALLERRMSGLQVRIASAGTLEVDGLPPLPEALELAREIGVDLDGHRARSLPPAALGSADLVIGFERLHLDVAMHRGAARPERCFTLPELVDRLAAVEADADALNLEPVERARAAVRLANEHRVEHPDGPLGLPELHDPLGHPRIVFVELASMLERLSDQLAPLLFGSDAAKRSSASTAR